MQASGLPPVLRRIVPILVSYHQIQLQHLRYLIRGLACLDDFVEKPWIGTKEYDKRGQLFSLSKYSDYN